jgi:hypothetical protein
MSKTITYIYNEMLMEDIQCVWKNKYEMSKTITYIYIMKC